MRLLASCVDSGSLKEVICNIGTNTSKKNDVQPLNVQTLLSQGLRSSVDNICIASNNKIILGRNNGVLELIGITEVPAENKTLKDPAGKEEAVALPKFDISELEVIDSVSGLLDDSKLAPFYDKSKKRVKLKDGFVSIQLLPGSKDTYFLATKSGLIYIVKIKDDLTKLSVVSTLEVKAPLDFAQLYDLDGDDVTGDYIFGYGGEENLIKLVRLQKDFSSLSQIWEAKNVKNDKLDLRVPVWPTALKFLKPYQSENLDKAKINYQFIVVTHWSHLGIYRTQHGRKPLEYRDLLPNREPLTQMEVIGKNTSPLGNLNANDLADLSFVTADTRHNVYKFDCNGQLMMKFGKGDITGASSFIKVYKQKYLLQGGLDRYARVFDLTTGSLLIKVYMGSKVNYLSILNDSEAGSAEVTKESVAVKRKLESEEQEIQDDELWQQLDKSETGKSKKARKSKQAS